MDSNGGDMDDSFSRKRRNPSEPEPVGSNSGEEVEFLSSGTHHDPSGTAKKSLLYDLRTGKPFEVPVKDQFGSCRFVSEFEKLNRVGEGTYGIVYRARDTKSGIEKYYFTSRWRNKSSSMK